MLEYFVWSCCLFARQSLHTLKTQLSCMNVGFHSNFCLGWEGRGLLSGSLLLVIKGGGGGGVDFYFIIFCGVGGW